ncbi:MAG: CHAT domain-containing protein [Puia sp.]
MGNPDSPDYFVRDHAVSYTYSARYLLMQFDDNQSERPGNFLGLAPVRYSSRFSLATLEGSDLSLSKIRSYFNKSRNFVASDATRNNFLLHYSHYEIIQLYTHASDTSILNEPVIYFSDSILYLSDLIPENKPETKLIVLSACETGIGRFYQGEGVFSFNRGFASLGIPSSITNLWSVDNESTYQITELFYKYLSTGMTIDIALQRAKLDFMKNSSKQHQLPYYWAATILAGKSDAIEFEKFHWWKDVLVIISSLIICFFIWQSVKGYNQKFL